MSGRDLFAYNPDWFEESDEEGDGEQGGGDGDGEEGGEETWDIAKYRREREEEDRRVEDAEKERMDELRKKMDEVGLYG